MFPFATSTFKNIKEYLSPHHMLSLHRNDNFKLNLFKNIPIEKQSVICKEEETKEYEGSYLKHREQLLRPLPFIYRVSCEDTNSYLEELCVHLRSMSPSDIEPKYVFNRIRTEPGMGLWCNCCNRFDNHCFERLFGRYCFKAVQRRYNEDGNFETKKCILMLFCVYFNRGLDYWVMTELDGIEEKMTGSYTIPKCMVQGSLKQAYEWVLWRETNDGSQEGDD